MSIVLNATSFEELEGGLRMKIADLKIFCSIRGGWGNDTIVELNECVQELYEMSERVKIFKEDLKNAKQQIIELKELFPAIENLTARLSHMKAHLPSHVPALQANGNSINSNVTCNKPPADKHDVPEKKKNENPSQDVEETKPKASKPVPTVEYITIDEYNSVPKYTRGRIPYDKVNSAIGEINRAVIAKYNLIRKPRSKLTPMELNKVVKYREQIIPESKGLYFVVDDDIKSFSKLKLDTSERSILTILRILKRLKEIRGPGNLIRYCVLRI